MKAVSFSVNTEPEERAPCFLQTNHQKQIETNNLSSPSSCSSSSIQNVKISHGGVDALQPQTPQNMKRENINKTGDEISPRGRNEKRHNKAILLKSHLTVNKSNDLMRMSQSQRQLGGGGGGGEGESVCVCVRAANIKNNGCLSISDFMRSQELFVVGGDAGSDKTHDSQRGVDGGWAKWRRPASSASTLSLCPPL